MLHYYSRIMSFLGKKDAGRVKLSIFFSVLESIFTNAPIMFLLYGFIKLINNDLGKSDIGLILRLMIAAVLIRIVLNYIIEYLMSYSVSNACERERLGIGDLFKKFSMGFYTKNNLGRAAAIVTTDLTFVEEYGILHLDAIIKAVVMMIIGLLMLCAMDIRIGLIATALSVISIIGIKKIERVANEEAKYRQAGQNRLTEVILEYAMGISVIKAFNISDERSTITKHAIDDVRESSIRFERRFMRPALFYRSVFYIGIGLIMFLSLFFVNNGSISMEYALVFIIFSLNVFLPAINLANEVSMFSIGTEALDRFDKLKNEQVMAENDKVSGLEKLDIEFDDVSFAYDDNEVLKHVSFKAKPGTMTALVGESGSGKTTIANLIVRFWDVKDGSIKIGGTDIRDLNTDILLKNMSMVFQRVYLFSDTIKNNIRFGKPDASDKEITMAAKAARCHDFIMALPDGYDTIVSEGGSSLSGGEKQRISIARAILKDAPIVLLDEATASVDPDNEKYIQEAINELVKNKTLIVIAHKLTTIMQADQILVVDDGAIKERGTHDELLKQQGLYSNLWNKRISAKSWRINQ